MESSTHTALTGCVASLRTSMHLLESSINILDAGVSDYPRLQKVVQTTKHFELLTETDLLTAQASLRAEIQPEITTLLSRVEAYLDKLARREQSLMARADLQEGRLAGLQQQGQGQGQGQGQARPPQRPSSSSSSSLEALRLQQLRLKKDRLAYAVGRLELQAGQRQRQLRKSMAVQGEGF